MPAPDAYRSIVERRVANRNDEYAATVRKFAYSLPDSIQELFASYAHLSDAELDFAFGYVSFYLQSRSGKIIPQQLHWSTKYALITAPFVLALNAGQPPWSGRIIGDFVEYSFASVRDKSKPDPASYDDGVINGAVIYRLLPFPYRDLEPDSIEAAEIGASWEIVRDHWSHLKMQNMSYLLTFVRNVKDGGAVALSDGAL